jgi:hypothetical protein
LVGTTHWGWVTETAHDRHHLVAHTKNFVQVLVDPAKCRIGQRVRFVVTAASRFSVTGDVLEVGEIAGAVVNLPAHQQPSTSQPTPLATGAAMMVDATTPPASAPSDPNAATITPCGSGGCGCGASSGIDTNVSSGQPDNRASSCCDLAAGQKDDAEAAAAARHNATAERRRRKEQRATGLAVASALALVVVGVVSIFFTSRGRNTRK